MIELRDVGMSYATRAGTHHVLRGVNMRLDRGRNIGILGRNGAGKSTLIRLMSGAERPISGQILRNMTVSWPLAFGGAFQPHLTGLDNLKFVCRIHGVDHRPCLPFILDFTELGEYLREPVLTYSHGMLTRLAFALSMAIEFDCFLIDEAMVVGDIRFHERCHEELFRKRRDRAFILVTHDRAVIEHYCERAAVLHQGHLVEFRSVNEAQDFYISTLADDANTI